MKYNEVKGLSEEEINSKALELKQELAKEKAQIASGTRSENPGKIKKLRRDIAKLLTEKNSRKSKESKKTKNKEEKESNERS